MGLFFFSQYNHLLVKTLAMRFLGSINEPINKGENGSISREFRSVCAARCQKWSVAIPVLQLSLGVPVLPHLLVSVSLPPCAFPFTGFKPEPTSRMTGLTDSSPWSCYVHVHICRAVMCACDATSLPRYACKPTSSSVAYKPTASCSLVPILINFFCVCSKEQHTMSDMWTFY